MNLADELDVSYEESITVAERDASLQRLRKAWSNLPPSTQAAWNYRHAMLVTIIE